MQKKTAIFNKTVPWIRGSPTKKAKQTERRKALRTDFWTPGTSIGTSDPG